MSPGFTDLDEDMNASVMRYWNQVQAATNDTFPLYFTYTDRSETEEEKIQRLAKERKQKEEEVNKQILLGFLFFLLSLLLLLPFII